MAGSIYLAMIIFFSSHGNLVDEVMQQFMPEGKKIIQSIIKHLYSGWASKSTYFDSLESILLNTWLLTDLIPGKFKRDPRTGTLLMKPTTTGKKPLWEGKYEEFTCSLGPKSILPCQKIEFHWNMECFELPRL